MRTGHWTYVSTKFIKQKESFKTMFVSSKEKEENGQMNLSIHLLGKSTNSQLINLEDLANIAAGINGLARHIIKTKIGRQRTNEEVKRLCNLGISDIKKGSTILEVVAEEKGQLKLDVSIEQIMRELIQKINEFEKNELEDADPQTFVFLDMLTRPLNSADSKLNLKVFSGSDLITESKTLDSATHEKVKKALKTFKITSGVLVGTLTEINLKTYSFQVQTIYKLERIFFEPNYADTIITLLRRNVEVTFERESQRSRKRKLIDVRGLGVKTSFTKKMMTATDLLESGVIGKLAHRKDVSDSVEYVTKLREDFFND